MMVLGNGKGETLEELFGTAWSHKNGTCPLAVWRLPFAHAIFSHTLYLLIIALSLVISGVITTYSIPTKHQTYLGSCQEVSSSLATKINWEIHWEVPADMSTCVSSLMTAQKSTQVSKGYLSVRSVSFPADHVAWAPHVRFLLYLSNTQVLQERWRRYLGSW